VVLSTDGVPQELIDSIEEAQDTECFVALLRGALARQRATRACAEQLPRTLNFNVCRGPVNRARKRSIEAFLDGELQVLEAALECMRTAEEDEGPEGEEDQDDCAAESAEDGPGKVDLQEMFRKKKKRRRT